MTDIVVREARIEDRAACAALYARVWPLAFSSFDRVIDRKTFDAETEDEEIFIALRDGAIIGFGGYYPPGNFLHHLYVDADAQGQGVRSALLKTIQAQAGPGLSLKVQISNHLARAFYAAHGFVEGESGQDSYGPGLLLTAR